MFGVIGVQTMLPCLRLVHEGEMDLHGSCAP
jgi:hypothetical protein